jgi:glycosyltransferase involved in cell wall biosynthesis
MTQTLTTERGSKKAIEGLRRKAGRKAKVLRVIARLILGGPARHVMILNSGLDGDKFSSYLAVGTASEGEQDIKAFADAAGIDLIVVPQMKRELSLFRDIAALFKLYRTMRRLKPDIVHTHTAKAGTLGRIAAAMARVPVKIHTFHGHIFHSYFNRFTTWVFILIERALAAVTDKIIVISRNQLRDVTEVYRIAPREKCVVIPLGLDIEPFLRLDPKPDRSGKIRREFSINEGTLLVGTVGRLVEIKNQEMFLRAAAMIKDKASALDVKFIIVGGGTLERRLKELAASLGIKDSVIFTGWRSDLVDIYRALDIVCLTSLNEGTPISFIEAMASARPVAATEVGGVGDVVAHSHSGLLSPSRDTMAFAMNIIRLLNDEAARARMGAKGRVFVSRLFSKERLIRDIEGLYARQLKEKGIF